MKDKVSAVVTDITMLLGLGIFVYGLYLAWRPLAFVVGGLTLFSICLLLGFKSTLRRQ